MSNDEYQFCVKVYTKRGTVLLTTPYFLTQSMAADFAYILSQSAMDRLSHVAVVDKTNKVYSHYNKK
jgi:hypothetical protein